MTKKKVSTLREYILLTLSHAEGRPTANPEWVRDRLKELFDCRAILVAKESHSESGYNLHAGILNRDASKNTATKRIRRVFHEWEGRTLDVQFHRNWASICRYLLKQDGQPLVWGEFSLEKIRDIAAGASPKSATKVRTSTPAEQLQLMGTTPPDIIIQKLERCGDWYEIYDDPILRDLAVHSYESLKKLYGDLMVLRDMRTTLGERFVSYLHRQGQPAEYEFEELQERYLLLDWLASCLCFHRPIMAKTLSLWGAKNPKKTPLLSAISRTQDPIYHQLPSGRGS